MDEEEVDLLYWESHYYTDYDAEVVQDAEDDDDAHSGSDDDSIDEHKEGSHEPVAAPAAPDVGAGRAVAIVTVGDVDALECGVCFLPLRPPIYHQCELGHDVVCSACRDKLEATWNWNGKCHVCGVATAGGYRRCHAMERLVDRIRVRCPYAAYGCDAAPPYHGHQRHLQMCAHGPRRCPGELCGFVGSTPALLSHFAGAHSWPCTAKARAAGEAFSIRLRLRVGFNFLLLADDQDDDRGDGDDGDQAQAAAAAGSVPVPGMLFLLNVTQERLGRAISVLCIYPHVASGGGDHHQPPSMMCNLSFLHSAAGDVVHCQTSQFKVVCTELSDGLPSPDGCFQFIVANAVLGEDDKGYIEVKARINIE